MEIGPILSTFRHNKIGPVLIAIQMAITLAILCNACFIVQRNWIVSHRATGSDETNLIVISNQWTYIRADMAVLAQADLTAIRALPGVADASGSNTYPLSIYPSYGDVTGIYDHLPKEGDHLATYAANYFVDEHGLNTLGSKLIAGRDFTTADVNELVLGQNKLQSSNVIVTRALAYKMFPHGDALGRAFYLDGESAPIIGTITGIVDNLDSRADSRPWSENTVLAPFRFVSRFQYYLVRTRPGELTAVMRSIENKLYEVQPERTTTLESVAAIRAEVYQDMYGYIILLVVVCALCMAVTAFGIVGLTSYWVSQRQRQIGVRRALGATRFAIVRYFQLENLLIASAAVIIGILLSVGFNLWIVNHFSMQRLPLAYPIVGAIIIVLLGQCAALWPALRAASIPPALASRAT